MGTEKRRWRRLHAARRGRPDGGLSSPAVPDAPAGSVPDAASDPISSATEVVSAATRSAPARLLEELPDAAVILDASGLVLWGNRRAEAMFGQARGETLGRSGLDFVHPDDIELVLRSLGSVQEKEVGTYIEVRLKGVQGWRLVELIGRTVGWYAPGAILFTLRDLTERRRFEVARDAEARIRSLVQNAAVITMLVAPNGCIESVSAALTRMLGHDPERVEHQPLTAIVHEDDRPLVGAALASAAAGATAAQPVTAEARLLRHGGGAPIPFALTVVNLVDDPTVGGYVVTAADVADRVAAERELHSTLSLLRATLEATADGLVVVDRDGNITSSNNRLAEVWRLPASRLLSPVDENARKLILDRLVDPETFLAKLHEVELHPEAESTDVLEFTDGRVFERFGRPQMVEGHIVGRVWSFRDITDRARLESELSYQAFHDSLTGLANKALFTDRLHQAVARMERTHRSIAVMFLDLDNFKTVNDSLGHSVGDDLLCQVAEALTASIRTADTAARLGGDEFAVLIEHIDSHADIVTLAERILAALRVPMRLGSKEIVPTASVGITFGMPGTTGEQLLRNADLAMYMAKEKGKDRYEEFQDSMHTAIVQRLELEADLRRTMGDPQELVVHYQPIMDLVTDELVGFEALVRWQHPLRGLLSPGAFIPFAEEMGLIDIVDRFVLVEACAQLHYWTQRGLIGPDTLLTVNLSAQELADPQTGGTVAELLAASQFDARNLILEVTESAMMKDAAAVAENLQALKDLGLRIALDDFGTGYSSLAYLQQLPIDILKIDRTFVTALDAASGGPAAGDAATTTTLSAVPNLHVGAGAATGDDPTGLAYAIIQIAENLGHTTIAEGVENEVQAGRLRQLGCRWAQGFHLGMPLDARGTEEMLRARSGLEQELAPQIGA